MRFFLFLFLILLCMGLFSMGIGYYVAASSPC